MAEIRKIIFIKNAVETLGYFSEQIARELERNGYETCFIDYERMYESMDVMLHFLDREETALVTFNFIGLRGEAVFQTESGRSIWQAMNFFFCMETGNTERTERMYQSPCRMGGEPLTLYSLPTMCRWRCWRKK